MPTALSVGLDSSAIHAGSSQILALISLATVVTGVFSRVHTSRSIRFIWLYTVSSCISVTVTSYLASQSISTIDILWLMLPVDTVLLLLFFVMESEFLRKNRKWLAASILLVVVTCAFHIRFEELKSLEELESYVPLSLANVYQRFSILLLILVFAFQLMRSEIVDPIDQNPSFWISLGLLIYTAGTIATEIAYVYGFSDETDMLEWRLLDIIGNGVNVICYILFIKGFLQYGKYDKSE